MRLELQPITYAEACAFIVTHHRHHIPTRNHICSVAANDGVKVVGVAVVGRPVTRHADDGWTAEIVRCCTDGTKNAPTLLMGAAWRAAKALGYRKLITYTLATEPGVSLRAGGFRLAAEIKGDTWNRPNRIRVDKHPVVDKLRWELALPGSHPTQPRPRVSLAPVGQLSFLDCEVEA